MRFSHHILLLSCLASIMLWSVTSYAQVQSDPCGEAPSQTSDVSVQLSLKNGQTVFREGEIIALTAEYSSTSPKKYYLDTRNYDRSGRLDGMEVFCVEPDTGQDPLSDYFNGAMGFMGGGLGGGDDLSKPYVVDLELNEWKSLGPGSYRLSIVSHRLSLPTDGNPYGSNAQHPSLRSNEVLFQVVKADAAWQAEQLSSARKAFDSPDSASDGARHAARILRFLGSEAATRELARRFWAGNDQPFGWDLKFGLVGSPFRETAIEEMKAALTDPQHPVTLEFVQILATLEMQSDPKTALPKYDEANKEAWVKTRDAYEAAFNGKIAEHMLAVSNVLQTKTGKARSVSVSELLQSDVVLSPVAKEQARQMLVSSWNSLTASQQNDLIHYRWDQIGGPEFLPVLTAIVAGAPNLNHDVAKSDRAVALRRIYALSPSQGRELILREIGDPRGDIGIGVLGLLPERELPRVEEPLLAKLKHGNGSDLDFQLLERYASRRSMPEIKAIYDDRAGEWACVPQNAMLRYFLRVEPEYGISRVRDALGYRKVTGCYRSQLTELQEDIQRPRLQQIAIDALNDPSPDIATDAAQALAKYGSPKAEDALWTRLEKFHDNWKDRQDQLRWRPAVQSDLQAEIRLEQVLVQAITNGQAWFTSEEEIARLKDLASPEMQSELDGVLREIQSGQFGLNLNWWPDGDLDYTIGRYSGKGMSALKEKLAQFPAGAHLDLITTVAEREHHLKEFTEVEDAATADGLVLQIQTPR